MNYKTSKLHTMKKLGKLKLNDAFIISDAEMRNIVGGTGEYENHYECPLGVYRRMVLYL